MIKGALAILTPRALGVSSFVSPVDAMGGDFDRGMTELPQPSQRTRKAGPPENSSYFQNSVR
jgi:hypothetical protein